MRCLFYCIIIVCIQVLFSCSAVNKINKADFDSVRKLYIISFDGSQETAYLRDNQSNLIRTEKEKADFIYNYNNYAAQKPQLQTNGFYNQYFLFTVDREFYNYRDLNKNFDWTQIYFSGIKNIKAGNFTQAMSDFDQLLNDYPNIRFYSDILFLKGYCQENLSNSVEASSNYQNFINGSVQQYSKLFSESSDDAGNYRLELQHAYLFLSNQNETLDQTVFNNDIPKYFNHIDSGFNYNSPSKRMLSSVYFVSSSDYEYIFDFSIIKSINQIIDIRPTIIHTGIFFGGELDIPLQLYKSGNHRLGFEATPVGYYYYYYQRKLTSAEDAPYYQVSHSVYNFGLESSAGFYILPNLYTGVSGQYLFYNQMNEMKIEDTVNGSDYIFSYWGNNFYKVDAIYYFMRDLGIDASVKNNDFYAGVVFGGYYFGYNISQQRIILNFTGYF